MEGISLKTFRKRIYPVKSKTEFITGAEEKLTKKRYIKKIFYTVSNPLYGSKYCEAFIPMFDFEKNYHSLHIQHFKYLSFNKLCQLRFNSVMMMHRSIYDLFEKEPQYCILRKIQNSMHRNGGCYSDKKTWNTIVKVYDIIRKFDLEPKDFTVTLDYTIGSLERGYSVNAGIYLDGVFAFLVHYKGKHVMTIGFSVARNHSILITQLQMIQKKRNRFLYKFSKNRMDFIIGKFFQHFKGFDIYLINGKSLARNLEGQYKNLVETAHYWLENPSENTEKERIRHQKEYQEALDYLKKFRDFASGHIQKFYSSSLLRFKRKRGGLLKYNGVKFHRILKNHKK